jgi:7-carboxy-7-deazaguanine synthase
MPLDKKLRVTEIFYSIQGESTWSGSPCVFIRLTGCNLRCTYCDTEYSFYGGKEMTISEILQEIQQYKCKLVELTGGEPLLQENSYPLVDSLVDNSYKVLIETSGSIPLDRLNPKAVKIVDIKTPSSHMTKHNHWPNLDHLNTQDEVKFVIENRADYEWSKQVNTQYGLNTRCKEVLFSPSHGKLAPKDLSNWICEDGLPVKIQLQLHKYLQMP